MMRKTFLVLCIGAFLCACSSSQEQTVQTVQTTTAETSETTSEVATEEPELLEEEAMVYEEAPQIVNIDDVLYYGTGEVVEIVDRAVADGRIENFYDSAIMPDMLDSANFGAEYGSMPYKFEEDIAFVDVKVGETWYRFEAASEPNQPVAD